MTPLTPGIVQIPHPLSYVSPCFVRVCSIVAPALCVGGLQWLASQIYRWPWVAVGCQLMCSLRLAFKWSMSALMSGWISQYSCCETYNIHDSNTCHLCCGWSPSVFNLATASRPACMFTCLLICMSSQVPWPPK